MAQPGHDYTAVEPLVKEKMKYQPNIGLELVAENSNHYGSRVSLL